MQLTQLIGAALQVEQHERGEYQPHADKLASAEPFFEHQQTGKADEHYSAYIVDGISDYRRQGAQSQQQAAGGEIVWHAYHNAEGNILPAYRLTPEGGYAKAQQHIAEDGTLTEVPGVICDAFSFAPEYLRLSQAEREKQEKQKENA